MWLWQSTSTVKKSTLGSLSQDKGLCLLTELCRSGHDPSRLFQRSVNKRNVPDYYEIIKEPMALSILKQKINKREYKNFAEFVRDCALVSLLWFK